MIWPFRRRHRPSASDLLGVPRAGLERALGAMPSVGVADAFVDLASRTGVDLGEVTERLLDRLGELAAQAGAEAGALAESESARQLRQVAARAADRAAELAYLSGAERLLEALPQRRRRSRRGLVIVGIAAGVAIGGALLYTMAQRQAEERRRRAAEETAAQTGANGNEAEETAGSAGANLAAVPETAVQSAVAPVNGFLDGLKQRFALARREARVAQAETERELWREYTEDVYHTNATPTTLAPLPYGNGASG